MLRRYKRPIAETVLDLPAFVDTKSSPQDAPAVDGDRGALWAVTTEVIDVVTNVSDSFARARSSQPEAEESPAFVSTGVADPPVHDQELLSRLLLPNLLLFSIIEQIPY